MPVSVLNLIEAVTKAHEAVAAMPNSLKSEETRIAGLLDAANLLCKELNNVAKDASYWAALKGGKSYGSATELASWLEDLADDKDGRRTDLAKLFMLVGYRPPEEAGEVVRGIVSALHRASLLALGQPSRSPVDKPGASLVSQAQKGLMDFAAQYCAAETHLKAQLRKSGLTILVKDSAKDALVKVVKWGATTLVIVMLGIAVNTVSPQLSPEAKSFVCDRVHLVPDDLQPLVTTAFCNLPVDGMDADVLIARKTGEVDKKLKELDDAVASLEAEIARQQAGTSELEESRKQADQARATLEVLKRLRDRNKKL
jgi:hypothetical protein